MSYQLRCLHVGMLPLSQSTLIESRCKFVLPSESITNRPPNLFMLAKKKPTLELQYAVRVFFLLYGNGVKYTLQTRWADITCSVRHTSCVLCCPSAVRVRAFCPCIMCQNSIQCVSGCRGVTQKDSCMLHVPDGLLQNPQLSALNSS